MKEIEVTVRTVEFQTFRVEVEDDFNAQEVTRSDVETIFFDGGGDWAEIGSETSTWEVDEVVDPSAPLGERRVQF